MARAAALTVCVDAPAFCTVTIWSSGVLPAGPATLSWLGPISRLWPVGLPPFADNAACTALSESI